MEKQNTLERIAQRAKAAGYQYGEHLDDDKQRDRPVTEDTEKTRAQVFHVYKAFGNARMQHHILRYDSVAIILMLAVADGALDLKDLDQMIKSGGEGQVDWAEKCLDLPVCRRVNRKGDVDDTQPMTPDSFITMFKTFMMQAGYAAIPGSLFPPGSIHMIRRELGKQLDERYTEVERSQHLTQADKAVFGQSYTADTSSCDGLSAFLRHQPDHTAIEYFQGLSQFRHEGLPTQLPAVLKDKTSRHPEVLR
ncbi:hypothetical protein H9Q69_013047 [Fusarium xylarioides]|nr:hypothetical protein H9Q69_013047 [Fusarium xylarioides]